MKKVLFIGAEGILGNYFLKDTSGFDVLSTTYSPPSKSGNYTKYLNLDITSKTACKKILSKLDVDTVVLAASVGNPNDCQLNKNRARKVNFIGVQNVIGAIKPITRLMYISSSYVYSGERDMYTEEDRTTPTTYYGFTKKMSEDYIKHNHKNFIILRPSTMFGISNQKHRETFAEHIIMNFKRKETTLAVNDCYTNFLYVRRATDLIKQIIDSKIKNEIFNVAGSEYLSYYEFALKLCKAYSLDESCVKPIENNKLNQLDLRPRKLYLNTKKVELKLNFRQYSLNEELRFMQND